MPPPSPSPSPSPVAPRADGTIMADTVQYLMEQMLPELEDFKRKRYFTAAEIKAIVQRRQDFEYRLKRRAAQKQDFLR